MPQIRTTDFHVVCGVLGVFATFFAFVSYLIKERLYISESLFALLAGVIAGPHVANFLRPIDWAGGEAELETTSIDFSRLALSIQVALVGIQLPAKFAKRSWRSLSAILGPGMIAMWVVSSFLVWAICALPDGDGGSKRMPFLHALAIGACIAPTDPVLAATVVKGNWADAHVPPRLAQLISAESGANDGLGFPFLFFALYLIKYVGGNGQFTDEEGGAGEAMKMFFGETVGFVVILGTAWGFAVGYGARKALKFAESMKYVDQESFFSFAVVMSIFLIGTCGLVGSDDILACFVAGNALSWDDWFRIKTAPDSFEPTVDMLLNMAIFVYIGAVCPWKSFAPHIHADELLDSPLEIWRLILLAIAVLALRRLPVMLALHSVGWLRPHVSSWKEAGFMGFFGPIGVSAIFYMHIGLEFLRKEIPGEGGSGLREDVRILFDVMQVCVWFVVVASTIVHGLAIVSYQTGLWIQHHTWKRSEQEHPYTLRGWFKEESEAIKHVAWLARLRDEEEHIKEQLLREKQAPPRPNPVFRRVRMNNPDDGSSRPQEHPDRGEKVS